MRNQNALFTCWVLYAFFRGRNISRIEREMRALGFPRFHRRILYRRNSTPGWIEKHGWNEDPAISQPHTALQPANAPGRNATVRERVPTHDPTHHAPRSGSPPASAPGGNATVRERGEREPHTETSSPNRTPDRHARPHSRLRPDTARQFPTEFKEWLETVSPGMTWSWRHQQVIFDQLERVTNGECKRLMLFMPPRHGKSELVTVRYTAWRMQRKPELNVIVGGYNQRLADRFSRKIRKVIAEAEVKKGLAGAAERAEPPASADGKTPAGDTAYSSSSPRSTPVPPPAYAGGSAFPFISSKPANTVSEWETRSGGGFRAVGVGGGVTGFGAQLVVIDDPVKSRAEAESETYRERVWDWFKDDIYTRLEPDAAVILIQTRWHEDDLAGRLLAEMHDGGEQWDVVNLPAIAERKAMRTAEGGLRNDEEDEVDGSDLVGGSDGAKDALPIRPDPTPNPSPTTTPRSAPHVPRSEDWRLPGEPLCPERYDLAALRRIRRRLGEYSFAALYQQRPNPAGGGVFKREWFKRFVDHAPPGLRWARGYDLAVSTRTNADYTASFRCAFDKEGNLYISGGFRQRLEYPDQRRFLIERIRSEPDTQHGIELALHGEALLQDLRRERGVRGHLLRGVKVTADKFTRALTWAPLAEEGKVILVRNAYRGLRNEERAGSVRPNSPPENSADKTPHAPLRLPHAPWIPDLIDELVAFPNGAHDDQIDAISIAVQMLKAPRHIACGF